MTPELKAQWLAALRSGEYEQGKAFLKRGNKYCCLGVLCQIQGANFKSIEEKYGSLSLSYNPREYFPFEGVDAARLAQMNDQGQTFPAIADWIEVNIPTTTEENENVEK